MGDTGPPRTGHTERQRSRHIDPDARLLPVVVHAAFFLLLGSSFVRFLTRDQGGARTGWVLALYAVFCLLYVIGQFLAPAPRPGSAPTVRHLAWLGSVSAVWTVLLALAPSATWCAMPLLFAGLYALPPRFAVPLAAVLTALVVASEIRVADGTLNPNMVVAPPALAAVATAVLVQLQRQAARQRVLIDDLVRTRLNLAATERRAGVLAERQRLAAEIHDTVAQGLSSQQMLLQAAERLWRTDPEAAHGHVLEAAAITSRGLAEARRFVHDLAPADLVEHSLPAALGALAERESGPGLTVEFRLDGDPGPLPERTAAALLRIAQGALANVREHAAATRAALTLTCLDDQISLDVADNGRGFDASSPPVSAPGRVRGHGLPAMRIRAQQSGGTLSVESTPGEGTVVTVAVPVGPGDPGDPGVRESREELVP
ncbi:sensor histidine kinase [Streptomyces prunicolor]|uniref:sensor histidine kinase n=1 Tax=Streptomyces prunicolor TaxID=67348 RepID=UPI003441D726